MSESVPEADLFEGDASTRGELAEKERTDKAALAHEQRVRKRQAAQFQRLKDDAQAIFGLVSGTPGVRTPEEWQALLETVGDEVGNGKFIVRFLGAERYLDPMTVAALISLRQDLLASRDNPTAADVMLIDAAVIGYYNMLRVQGWIGNLGIVVERELFGEAPLTEIHGIETGKKVAEQLARLSEVMIPLLDRCHRMVHRSLGALRH